MILERLSMENFKSHKNTQIDFNTGISIIIGENGAGKSSILEAVSFALFKQYSGRKVESLIRNGKQKMGVELDFFSNGRSYRVSRIRGPSGSRTQLKIKEERGYHTLTSKDKQVTKEIQRILDIDSALFLNAIYVKQGEISDLIEKSPAEKKQMIGKFLGIDSLEKAWKNMKPILDKYKGEKLRLEGKLESLTDLKEDIKFKKGQRNQMKFKIQDLNKVIQEVSIEFSLLRDKKEVLDFKSSEFEKAKATRDSKKQLLSELQREMKDFDKQIIEMKGKEQEIEDIKPKIRKLDILKTFQTANEKLKHLLQDEKRLIDILDDIHKFKKIMDDNELFFKDYSHLNTELSSLQFAREQFQGNRVLMEQYRTRKSEIRDKIQLSMDKVTECLQRSNRALEANFSSVEKLEEHFKIVKPQMEAEINEFVEKIQEIQRDISNLQVQNKDLKNPIEELETVKDLCPICKSTITPAKRDELIKDYKDNIEANKRRSEKLKEKLERIEVQKDVLDDRYSKIQNINLGILREHLNSVKESKEKIKNINSNIQDLQEKIIILEGIEKDINEKRKVLEDIKGKYEDYIAARGSLESLGNVEEHQSSLEGIQSNIDLINAEISALMDMVGDSVENLPEEIAYLEDLSRKYQMLLGVVSQKDALMKKLEDTRQNIEERLGEIDALNKEIESLNYNKEIHERIKQECDTKNDKLSHLNEKKHMLMGQEDQLSHSLEELEEKVKSYQKYQKELSNLKDFIKLLNLIRDLYGKDGIQKDLRSRSKSRIEENTRNFFEKFNFEYSDINLNDDYDITVYGPGGKNSLDMMSGGEKIAVALALRLGITQTISGGNLELIMLDEPTIHLDSYRRQELIDLLKNMSIIPQMIIVTHDADLEDAADNIIRVKKEEGISFIVES